MEKGKPLARVTGIFGLIIIAIMVIFLAARHNTADTANAANSRYTNNQWDFSLEYNSEWEMERMVSESFVLTESFVHQDSNGGIAAHMFFVIVPFQVENAADMTVEEIDSLGMDMYAQDAYQQEIKATEYETNGTRYIIHTFDDQEADVFHDIVFTCDGEGILLCLSCDIYKDFEVNEPLLINMLDGFHWNNEE
jgi:hypothetical protein